MRAEEQAAIARKIIQIAELGEPPSELGDEIMFIGNDYGVLIWKDRESVYECQKLVSRLLKHYGATFSQAAVESFVKETLVRVKMAEDPEQEAAIAIAEFVELVEAWEAEQSVYIPISGLEISTELVRIGKINLLPTNSVKAKLQQILRPKGSVAITGDNESAVERLIREKLGTAACGELIEVVEPKKAEELALVEAQRVIDVLIYMVTEIHGKDYSIAKGLRIQSRQDDYLLVAGVGSDHKVSVTERRMGASAGFMIDADTWEEMKRKGILVISDLLTSAEPSELEEVILRSLHLFAESQGQNDIGNELMNLTTCLEMFIVPEGDEPITLVVSEGVAILLGTSLEERRHIKNLVAKMYGKRSRFTHGEKIEVEEEQIRDLRQYTMSLMQHMIGQVREWKTVDDVRKWIEEKRLS